MGLERGLKDEEVGDGGRLTLRSWTCLTTVSLWLFGNGMKTGDDVFRGCEILARGQ